MNSYKGFEYPTVREFFADEEKYTDPNNENNWLYNMGGVNITISKEKGNKEIDEIFKHFIDVVYEDSKKVTGAVQDMVSDVNKKNMEVIDKAVQDKTIDIAKKLNIDLDTIRKATSNDNDLSDEELEKISNAFNSVVEESEELKKISELPSNNGVTERDKEDITEKGEMKKMIANVNPDTGERSIIGDGNELDDSETFDDMVKRINNSDLKFEHSAISEEEISDFINGEHPGDNFIDLLNTGEIEWTKDEIKQIMNVVNERMENPDLKTYKVLPERVQDMINQYGNNATGNSIPVNSIQFKTMRNNVSDSLIDEFINSLEMTRIKSNLGKELQNLFTKTTEKISNDIVGFSEAKLKSYRESLEKVTDPKKREKLKTILDKIDDAYNLDSLKEYSKRCKIKKIELVKPLRIFDRITNKYKNSTYDIFSLEKISNILSRHIMAIDENKYNINDAVAFLISFCKQVTNYSPDNSLEHLYIYFVTYNIILLDININEGNKEISDKFLKNVLEVIDNLKYRNSTIL